MNLICCGTHYLLVNYTPSSKIKRYRFEKSKKVKIRKRVASPGSGSPLWVWVLMETNAYPKTGTAKRRSKTV
jgi:hypothetical protein